MSRSEIRSHLPFAVLFLSSVVLVPVAAILGSRSVSRRSVRPPRNVTRAAAAPTAAVLAAITSSGGPISADLFGRAEVVRPQITISKTAEAGPALVTAAAPDPLAGYVVTGLIQADGKWYALIEDRKTHIGEYVAAGDDFYGVRVASVGQDGVKFDQAGEQRMLAMNQDYSLTGGQAVAKAENSDETQAEVSMLSDNIAQKVTFSLNNALFRLIDGKDDAKMRNDVFEGKMSVEEYNQKGGRFGVVVDIDGLSANKTRAYELTYDIDIKRSGATDRLVEIAQ